MIHAKRYHGKMLFSFLSINFAVSFPKSLGEHWTGLKTLLAIKYPDMQKKNATDTYPPAQIRELSLYSRLYAVMKHDRDTCYQFHKIDFSVMFVGNIPRGRDTPP